MSRKKLFFGFIFALYGSPVYTSQSGPNWIQVIYSFTFISLSNVVYFGFRFQKYLVPSAHAAPVPLDRLPLIAAINAYEIIAVIIINYYHTFVLMKRHKIYRTKIFYEGRVLECLGQLDALLLFFCLVSFVTNFKTQVTKASLLRFITYSFMCSVNHLIAFQFCAVLKYHAAVITNLTKLLGVRGTPNLKPCIIKYWDTLETIQIVNTEFAYQISTVFVALVIDIVYLISYTLILVKADLLHGLEIVYFIYVVIIRIMIILYLSGHCQNITRVGEEFNIAVFSLVRANSSIYNKNGRLVSFLRMKRVPLLTAFGFFEYGCSIVVTVTSAVATYLVVLLQFS